jgi:hypothetical protein
MLIEQSLCFLRRIQFVSTATDVQVPAKVLCIVWALLMWSTSKALVHQLTRMGRTKGVTCKRKRTVHHQASQFGISSSACPSCSRQQQGVRYSRRLNGPNVPANNQYFTQCLNSLNEFCC